MASEVVVSLFNQSREIVARLIDSLDKHHTMAFAASLSYFFVLSLFPLLIFLSTLVAYLPIPNLFDHILDVLARMVPVESMTLVRKIVADALSSRHGGLLTFGIAFSVWTASSGFAAMIEALNVAYEVPETRRIWTTRALSVGLMLLIGALLIVALGFLLVGPAFGQWVSGKIGLAPTFAAVWPYLRWAVALTSTVVAIEFIYFWGPDIRQKFVRTLPGAMIAVGGWLGLSHLLAIYFRHFAGYNKTYGTMGAAIALSVWFYWTSFIILVGAELNATLLHKFGTSHRKQIRQEIVPPQADRTGKAA
jgi:membrane protein